MKQVVLKCNFKELYILKTTTAMNFQLHFQISQVEGIYFHVRLFFID